jgi:hypothetical protein
MTTIQKQIEILRAKPEQARKQIAFWSAFGITFVIFAFWISSFTSVGSNAQATVSHAVAQAGTPAQSLVASVGGFFDDIKDLVFKPRTVTYTDVIVAPGR